MQRIASLLVTQDLLWAFWRLTWQRRLTRLVAAERTPKHRRAFQSALS